MRWAWTVKPSSGTKCDRCWHYRDEHSGLDEEHPTICGRCTGNLYGTGEPRRGCLNPPDPNHSGHPWHSRIRARHSLPWLGVADAGDRARSADQDR